MKKANIRLLVTLHGKTSRVTIERIDAKHPPIDGETVVDGSSMYDVMHCIEDAALESQGRTS